MKQLKSRPKELKGLKPKLVKKAKDYDYSKIEFYVTDNNLYIKITGSGVKAKWFILKNYKSYTALQVIDMVDLGRHYVDGILQLWKERNLNLGWVVR
jgi:hypothetical protein